MKKEEIVTKSIEKAQKNGYDGWDKNYFREGHILDNFHYALIFDHDFLKAFFGINTCCKSCGKIIENIDYCCGYMIPTFKWLYYGEQLFLSKNRLQYLEKFL